MTDPSIPRALHLGEDELPFIDVGDGNKLRVAMVDQSSELWIVENIFMRSYEVPTHRHTGPVYAYTASGAWKYKEYPEVNRAGSFLFEPVGSVHTLTVLEDNTRVWFQMYGVNENIDADGNVESIFNGPETLEFYLAVCEAEGHGRPNVVVNP